MEMDLHDSELEKAATKIQATFKGYKVRKEVKTGDEGKRDEPQLTSSDSVSITIMIIILFSCITIKILCFVQHCPEALFITIYLANRE